MFYAMVGEERRPPNRGGEVGYCPHCKRQVVGKRGKIVEPHWAHRNISEFCSEIEKETPWHRFWKSQFASGERQEVRFEGAYGYRVADAVTDCGLVVEIQHSAVELGVIRSRQEFYARMDQALVWIFDIGWFGSLFAESDYGYWYYQSRPNSSPRREVAAPYLLANRSQLFRISGFSKSWRAPSHGEIFTLENVDMCDAGRLLWEMRKAGPVAMSPPTIKRWAGTKVADTERVRTYRPDRISSVTNATIVEQEGQGKLI